MGVDVQAVALDNKLFVQGTEKIPVDVVAFVGKDPVTGEKIPFIGTSYVRTVNGISPQQQAENTVEFLNKLDELGVAPYKVRGIYQHIFLDANKNPVDGVMIVTDVPKEILSSGNPDAAFEAFKKSANHLSPNERAIAIDAYSECCRINRVSTDTSGFGAAATQADVSPSVRIGSSDAVAVAAENKYFGRKFTN